LIRIPDLVIDIAATALRFSGDLFCWAAQMVKAE